MNSKTKKITIGRELKVSIPIRTLKKFKKATMGYGNTTLLATASGINRVVVINALKDGKATKPTIESLLKGIELLQKQEAA